MAETKEFEQKVGNLKEHIRKLAREDVMLAFSGGVDSSLLLKLFCDEAEKTGTKVYALTLHTLLHPMMEAVEARELAEQMGAQHIIVEVDELEEADILNNPEDRCYRCKKCLFVKVLEMAKSLGVQTVIEGTNENDLHEYRPGIQAIQELGLISPLAEAKITKEEVRKLAELEHISTAIKPSTPCLATRFPYGTELSYEKMRKVEEAECFVRKLGIFNVRVRVHGDIARLEVDANAMDKVMEYRKDIIERLKKMGYVYVTLDLEGFRSGSMDVYVKSKREKEI